MSDELREKFLAGLSELYSRKQIVNDQLLERPPKSGFNLWFFKEIPDDIPANGCFKKDGLTLLYVGIAPDSVKSKRNLYQRIRGDHCKGNAKISTLRLSLGVLLTSDYPLRRVKKATRKEEIMTFTSDGEKWLNDWMDENAFVGWVKHPTPWEIKEQVIEAFSPPLNIKDGTHLFGEILNDRRVEAKRLAREMPAVHE